MSNPKNTLAKAFKSISFAAIFFSATPTLAFDDNRQGFILGLGAGFHSIDIDFLYNGSNVGSQSESGLATSFKIGGGLTDQFALYYVRNVSWYSAPYFDGYSITDATYTVGLTGVGSVGVAVAWAGSLDVGPVGAGVAWTGSVCAGVDKTVAGEENTGDKERWYKIAPPVSAAKTRTMPKIRFFIAVPPATLRWRTNQF